MKNCIGMVAKVWSAHDHAAKLAFTYLASPTNIVPYERLFSLSGTVL